MWRPRTGGRALSHLEPDERLARLAELPRGVARGIGATDADLVGARRDDDILLRAQRERVPDQDRRLEPVVGAAALAERAAHVLEALVLLAALGERDLDSEDPRHVGRDATDGQPLVAAVAVEVDPRAG